MASVVVFVGGNLGAGADDEVAAQGVEGLALVELSGDAGALGGVGAVGQQEVGAHDASVLGERCGERALRARVLQARDEQARGHPPTLKRRGRPEQVVVVPTDAFGPGARAQHRVDGQSGWLAEAVQA